MATAKDKIPVTGAQITKAETIVRDAFYAGANSLVGDYSDKGFLYEILRALGIENRIMVIGKNDTSTGENGA